MSILSIFDLSILSEKIAWIMEWENFSCHEPYAHPSYAELFMRSSDKGLCVRYNDSGGTVLFPVILRSISDENWGNHLPGIYDLTTPYGYGGPFVNGTPDPEGFWNSFDIWAKKRNVVTMFVRRPLFKDRTVVMRGEERIMIQNVVRSLDEGFETIWKDYEHKVRKNIKRAQMEGLRVEIDIEGKYLDEFVAIYSSTMARRGASESYYFKKEFFQKIVHDLSKCFVFFHVFLLDKIISTELILVSDDFLYSFLGGTLPEGFPNRSNDLLKHSVIQWGIENKKKAYVLGGGYTDGDGIFLYKRSFAPNGILPFSVGRRILDQNMNDTLISERQKFELAHGNDWKTNDAYFPSYRS